MTDTDEQGPDDDYDPDLLPVELGAVEERYIKFGIPDVGYSTVRIPLRGSAEADRAEVTYALRLASFVREEFLKVFPLPEQPTYDGPASQEGPPQRQQGGQRPQGQQQQRPPQQGQQRGPRGTGAFCPEHIGAAMLFSTDRYNREGDRMYHKLNREDQYRKADGGTVSNCGKYWRETVDADGHSNEHRPMPPEQQEKAYRAQTGRGGGGGRSGGDGYGGGYGR